MQPLADRLRPTTLDDMIGQHHIIGDKKIINTLIKNNSFPSIVLTGPTGTGKSSLSRIIAKETGKKHIYLNAVNCGVKEIKEIIDSNKRDLFSYNGILLTIDEFQVLNKKQQQTLLEVIEDGSVTLIAITSDNPFFVIYKAILSRSIVFEFKPISRKDIFIGLKKTIPKIRDIYQVKSFEFEDEALNYISEVSNGDMRSALNRLELAINLSINHSTNSINLTLQNVLDCSSVKLLDIGSNDSHHDIISAFYKSLRGSDCDASLHYLARLILSEDLLGPCRTMLCVASEDIGVCNPQAIVITQSCVSAALQLGYPAARLALAEAAIYLSLSPKSSSTLSAIDLAIHDLKNIDTGDIPNHLKDSHYSGATVLDRGIDYKYPHDYENNYVEQQYLPDAIKNRKYYEPGNNKTELAYFNYWKNIKSEAKSKTNINSNK